jgi:putative transposase
MPRKNLIRTSQYYYHVTTRANHRQWFSLSLNDVWEISLISFEIALKNHPANIAQFVLMNNHYHLLIQTPKSDIDKFMYYFNKELGRRIRIATGLENRMFGSNYKWSIIKQSEYFYNVFRYIYQNPVRAGIVQTTQSYPFSSNYYFHKKSPLFFHEPIVELEINLEYLNEVVSEHKNVGLKKGLQKSIFKEVIHRKI